MSGTSYDPSVTKLPFDPNNPDAVPPLQQTFKQLGAHLGFHSLLSGLLGLLPGLL